MKSFQLFFTFVTWMTISQAIISSGSTVSRGKMMACLQKDNFCKNMLKKSIAISTDQKQVNFSPLATISRW